RAGASAGYGHGGNVYMTGGRLERCLVSGGRANWGGWNSSKISYGMGLYASGGIIDSCFFKDNRDDNNNGRNYGSVCLEGTATMVNCTVTGGYSRYVEASGIYLNSAKAKVVNCVAYGNYGGQNPVNTAASNIGLGNLGRYFHCAAAFPNASCATWTVLTDADFANYRTLSSPAHIMSLTYADLNAYMTSEEYAAFDWHPRLASPTVDSGTTDTAYRPADSSAFDLAGKDRIAGASIDLGCWEYDQTQFACAGNLSSYGVLENAAITFNAVAVGPASDTVFRWDYGNGVTEDTRETAHSYTYPAAGCFTVRLAASPDGGTNWTDWYTVPTSVAVAPAQMFVDSNCATPAFPYKTRATAANTLAAAVGALTNNVSENKTIIGGVDIVILKGSQSNDTGFFLATAVTIRGETGNPADAEIVDNVPGFRAFTLSHSEATVKDLTISGSGLKTHNGCGGHVWMSAGLVANCVIKDGNAAPAQGKLGRGGNVCMSGGRLERSLVTGGKCSSGVWPGSNASSYGMALYASGGVIDSCFFKDNKVDDYNSDSHGGVYLNGAAILLNCTVTGGSSYRDKVGVGVRVNNANAKVVNCVFYGNGDNSASANFGTGNLNRYFYCGSSETNASCATWTVLTEGDFVDAAAGNLHQKRDSQLIGRGTLDTAYRPADSVTLDLDGNERVLNRTIDLGCWEVQAGLGFQIIVR
nr:PKD domain-containing protein [Kiritimatiellia bacterium]